MIKKITIEITEERAIVKLLDENGKEINGSETVPTEDGTRITYAKEDFEEMDDEIMPEDLWEALEQNFFIHDVLTAMHDKRWN
ncbi:hypothetical protein [Bacillus cabrialesii]|uniref:hypothetical protein n=1 Tax=Bacillus cabrialesii TaxID=2487276 RepID=UPI0028FB194E|nr:hypothetical protein [Bacillus cabrialesii]MDU0154007.1 hypothetical protein [Bacillus cabrialesii]